MAREDRSRRLTDALALVEAEGFDEGAAALRELLPDLEGRERFDALLALGRANLWTEHTEEALDCAERAIELAERTHDLDMRAPAHALLSQAFGQRGEPGDLGIALELGDRALEEWVPGSRPTDLALHESLHALTHYWSGSYASSADLGRRGDDGATEALALVGLGRVEEAIERSDGAIASAREAGSALSTAYALCCSTAALRDVLDLSEARRRNEEAVELFRGIGFESGAMQGEIDLLYADLAAGEIDGAARAWPVLWSRLGDATGWERWLAPGRLSVARAEIAILQERWAEAANGAIQAIEIAREISREKYEASARIALGSAFLAQSRPKEARVELRIATASADRLGYPPTRWRARAALARSLEAIGDEDGASAVNQKAREIIVAFTSGLIPEHAKSVLGSLEVQVIVNG